MVVTLPMLDVVDLSATVLPIITVRSASCSSRKIIFGNSLEKFECKIGEDGRGTVQTGMVLTSNIWSHRRTSVLPLPIIEFLDTSLEAVSRSNSLSCEVINQNFFFFSQNKRWKKRKERKK
jgi:hypothetical protein